MSMKKRLLRGWFAFLDSGGGRMLSSVPFVLGLLFLTPFGRACWEILIKRNMDFPKDWYQHNTWMMKYLWLFITDEKARGIMWPWAAVLVLVVSIILFVLHQTIYRYFFPKYLIVRDGLETPDGAVYYSSESYWARRGRQLRADCGARAQPAGCWHLVNRHALLNIMSPTSSMTVVRHLNPPAQERSTYALRVWEERGRIRSWERRRPVITVGTGGLATAEYDVPLARREAQSRMKSLISASQESVHANVFVNKNVITKTAFQIPISDIELLEKEAAE